eukprot:m.45576 g.45576  ORF g.45576 m.45576 type:complete len:67 (-) comp15138_c0_seq1:60-260(-)
MIFQCEDNTLQGHAGPDQAACFQRHFNDVEGATQGHAGHTSVGVCACELHQRWECATGNGKVVPAW